MASSGENENRESEETAKLRELKLLCQIVENISDEVEDMALLINPSEGQFTLNLKKAVESMSVWDRLFKKFPIEESMDIDAT